jgi:signal transduction histidine kinase
MGPVVSCILTKGLIPYVEREVGPPGVAALVRTAGRSREYLMAEYNWLPFERADRLIRLSMELMGETDEDRWARRFADDFMDWKPSRDERGWAGSYTMSLGSPRALYAKASELSITQGWGRTELLSMGRGRARFQLTPHPGLSVPRWACTWNRVCFERYPTNWKLPRAAITELACAAHGDPTCRWDVRWKNPSLGARFWAPTIAGAAMTAVLPLTLGPGVSWWASALTTPLPLATGGLLGFGLLQRERRQHLQRLLDVQAEEILYSSRKLEDKFRDLESKVEQLSLLIELSGAVNATLDVERIYEQAVQRLVHQMGYQAAHLLLVDHARRVMRTHRMAGQIGPAQGLENLEAPLDPGVSATARVAITGLPVLVNDVEVAAAPVYLPTVRALDIRGFVAVPLRVKERVLGVLTACSGEADRFGEADVELVAAVANHVALAVERAESFQTIEELTRGLEDKVRVRTEQLRAANEELQAAYRELQAAQMQLVQREKMASVGQLVAGVAHELNNPIGFVFSNVSTLDDFVRRLRAMLDVYRAVELPAAQGDRVREQWEALKVDYALKYVDSMIEGIREGAERARKIVRDLRVFARSDEDAWQSVDLHEEIESSLTLLNHLLKDRVTVRRAFGALPPVECVRSQLDQVFLNLLANAAQAIAGSGTITIATRQEGDDAVVTIADTGPGIAPELLARIFDPFFTTKPVGEGTGLGLSISYEILTKHGGDIRAESTPGQGAVFTVRLPIARGRG